MTNNFYYSDYLQHYGVKGMKWGIRRTPEQLGHKIAKLEKKNVALTRKLKVKKTEKADAMDAKSGKLYAKASKLSVKANKLRSKSEKFESKSYRTNDQEKREKFAAKASEANLKATKLYNKSEALNKKAFTLKTKASAIHDYQESVKVKINKNKRLSDMYKTTIDGLNDGTIEQGKLFMKYLYEYEE